MASIRSSRRHPLRRLGPATKLYSERDSELREFEHMLEAELIRDVVPAMEGAGVSRTACANAGTSELNLLVGGVDVLMVGLFEGTLCMHVNA